MRLARRTRCGRSGLSAVVVARLPRLTTIPVRLQIDGLIVNCSAFNPTPSLSAAVVNHFKMRQDVRTYNLSGMGCAASVIGIDLAMELLAVSPYPKPPPLRLSAPLSFPRLSMLAGLEADHPQTITWNCPPQSD